MGTGYKLSQGLLFDKRWEGGMRMLSPKKFHKLFWELYDYQKNGGDSSVDDHDDHVLMGSIVTFVVPQIRNRIIGSRRKKESEQGIEGTPPPTPRGTPPPTSPIDERKEKGGALPIDKLRENKLIENKLRESNAPPSPTPPAPKTAYGEFSNVYLTEAEREALAEKYGETVTVGLIDNFSRKIKAKGYQYENHYATILDWASKDGVKPKEDKSYDLDEFWEAALQRSYELLGEGTEAHE